MPVAYQHGGIIFNHGGVLDGCCCGCPTDCSSCLSQFTLEIDAWPAIQCLENLPNIALTKSGCVWTGQWVWGSPPSPCISFGNNAWNFPCPQCSSGYMCLSAGINCVNNGGGGFDWVVWIGGCVICGNIMQGGQWASNCGHDTPCPVPGSYTLHGEMGNTGTVSIQLLTTPL